LGLAWLTPVVFAFALLGMILLARRDKTSAALIVLPALLTLGAAMIKQYPYGVSVRVNLYLVPAVLILAAFGASALITILGRVVYPRRAALAIGVLLATFGASRISNDLGHPYRTAWDRTARDFARWFWQELAHEAELVCVRSDLGIPIQRGVWAYDG